MQQVVSPDRRREKLRSYLHLSSGASFCSACPHQVVATERRSRVPRLTTSIGPDCSKAPHLGLVSSLSPLHHGGGSGTGKNTRGQTGGRWRGGRVHVMLKHRHFPRLSPSGSSWCQHNTVVSKLRVCVWLGSFQRSITASHRRHMTG